MGAIWGASRVRLAAPRHPTAIHSPIPVIALIAVRRATVRTCCDLNRRDREICEAIGPALRERGMIFVGIDLIGDYLTKINVTSPTCSQETGRYDGVNLEGQIWDAIEGKRQGSGEPPSKSALPRIRPRTWCRPCGWSRGLPR